MPVQFVCPQCRRTLSVTRRKIGQEVTCPKCSAGVTVPASQAVFTGASSPSSLPDELDRLSAGDLVDFGDLPELMVAAPRVRPTQPLRLPPAQAPAAEDGVSISRASIYVQAVLLLLIAGVAFGLGYWFGGVDARHRAQASPTTDVDPAL